MAETPYFWRMRRGGGTLRGEVNRDHLVMPADLVLNLLPRQDISMQRLARRAPIGGEEHQRRHMRGPALLDRGVPPLAQSIRGESRSGAELKDEESRRKNCHADRDIPHIIGQRDFKIIFVRHATPFVVIKCSYLHA